MTADEYRDRLVEIDAEYQTDLEEYRSYWAGEWSVPGVFYVPLGPEQAKAKRDRARAEASEERIRQLKLEQLERAAATGLAEDEPAIETPKTHRGAKSQWRRADLETIFVRHPKKTPRALVADEDLIEKVHFQRIYEVRRRGDVAVDDHGRLALPEGTTSDGGGWVTLPRKP